MSVYCVQEVLFKRRELRVMVWYALDSHNSWWWLPNNIILSPARQPFHHSGTEDHINNEASRRIQERNHNPNSIERIVQKSSFQHSCNELTPASFGCLICVS
jgi:hypothetical protein